MSKTERLLAENAQLREELSLSSDEVARLLQKVALLEGKLDALARRLFGNKSEQLDQKQMLLLLGVEAEAAPEQTKADLTPMPEPEAEPPAKSRRRFGRKERWPEDLPVEEEVILPAEVAAAPESFREIDREVTEQLDYRPAQFLRRRIVRPVFVRRREGKDLAPITAALPAQVVERGIAAPGLIAAIITSKYCDHLPLYRQQFIFETRHRVFLSRQNMARWMAMAAFWMRPIYEMIRLEILADGYVMVDETPVAYLDPGRGEIGRGYLWAMVRPGGDAFFHWETGRGAECLERLIPRDYRGVIQCDAYAAYGAFTRDRVEITLAACLAHIRRKFFDAKAESPGVAGWVLYQIGILYRIEAEMRRAGVGTKLRQVRRSSESAMIYRRLERALIKLQGRYLPASEMGKALRYALSNWAGLASWLADGRVEIDNNLVENAIRPTALGKKNWLFMGCADAGENGAILFTLVECCRRREINPFDYLRDVLQRIPGMTNHEVAQLTPDAWARAHQPKARSQRGDRAA